MLGIIIAVLIGGLAGYLIARRIHHIKPVGTLRVDSSDPDGPYLFLELAVHPNALIHDTYVTMRVNTRSYISQE
jgi:hypothetical protein